MGEVVRLPGGTVTLQAAVDAFLEHQDLAPSTGRVYRASLASLVAELGPAIPVGKLSALRLTEWFRARYAGAAPATWNRELATLRAAVGWWRRRGWLVADLTGDCPRGCTHGETEPECGLDEAIANGLTEPERVESFRRLLASRERAEED